MVNFTQQKPRDTDAESIVTDTGAPRVVSEAATPVARRPARPPASRSQPSRRRCWKGLRAAEQARQDEIARIKADNCQQSRDVLSRLTLKNRIRVKGADGEYTGDAGRRTPGSYCGSPGQHRSVLRIRLIP